MRKVVLGMNVSLDGYVATADGKLDWAFANFDQELMANAVDTLSQIDTALIGRNNYLEQAATWPNSQGPIADIMNSITKIIFSKTLTKLEWKNSRLATGSPAEEIARLKQQPGKDIGVAGGASLAQSLSRDCLIDEYRLTVHPAVLGKGMPLFVEPLKLKLVSTRSFASGVLFLVYQLT